MNLTIDIGNTSTKLHVFEQSKILFEQTYATLQLDDIKSICIKSNITNAILSTVNKEQIDIETFLQKNINFIKLDTNTSIPIINKYNSPETLGKDRLAVINGAYTIHPNNNTLVIDAGTCITFDFINDKNEYLGGSISPGINMRLKALNQYTKRLPLVEYKTNTPLIGNTTESSILSGVEHGILSEVKGIIDSYMQESPNLKILITGGNANFFESLIKNEIFAVPNLVAIGLNTILNFNIKRA